jgi:hypothetical protein
MMLYNLEFFGIFSIIRHFSANFRSRQTQQKPIWLSLYFWNQFGNAALEVEGPTLELSKISRLDMGVYLCIASNGIPPAVSKRIHVSVDCTSSKNQF